MKPKYGVALPVLAIAAFLTAGVQPSTADPTTGPQSERPLEVPIVEKAAQEKQWRTLRVHNVTPHIIAWLVDPAHNPAPTEFSSNQTSVEATAPGNPYRPGTRNPASGTFGLPAGVDQIVAIDSQNTLLVYGTEAGLRQIETLVGFLDRPIRLVEIEASFVEIIGNLDTAFGVDWSGASKSPFSTNVTAKASAPTPGTFSIGYVRGNWAATLKAMVAGGKAKVISTPRVTAMNNFPSSVYTSISTPVVLGLKDDKGNFRELINGVNPNADAPYFYLTTNLGLTVTPTINNDGTVTVVMQPSPTVQLSAANDKQHSLPLATQSISTIANIRDGDTIALGGLSTRMMKMDNPFRHDNAEDKQGGDMILFVTARIVHRADEVKAPAPVNP